MKNKKNIIAIIGGIILIAIIIFALFFFKSSKKTGTPTKQTGPYTKNTVEMQAAEEKAFSEVEIAASNFITKEFPNASDINPQMEFTGMSYGIVNISFKNNGSKDTRKVYLEYDGTKWMEIYSGKDQITCEKVKELINRQTILSSMCK